MSAPASTIHVTPLGQEWLSFSFSLPADWQRHELPEEQPNFDNPAEFAAAVVCTASFGVAVFSVGVRPAYDSGSLRDWAGYLVTEEGLTAENLRDRAVGPLEGIAFDSVQENETGRMIVRNVLVTDSGRLYTLCVMGAEQIFPSVEPILERMIDSFAVRPRVTPVEGALSDDITAFDPEHPMNVRMRDSGAGLVPNVLEINSQERYALVGAGAIEATFRIPFGWHVVDDGRRTLVFDPDGDMQINLDRRPSGTILEDIVEQYRTDQPQAEHVFFDAGDMKCVGFRNFRSGDEILEQVFLVKEMGGGAAAIVARVTAGSERISLALDAAGTMANSLHAPVVC